MALAVSGLFFPKGVEAAPPPAAARPVTIVAVVDSGFSPYPYDFVGHQHPWNTDGDANNDFDFTTDPATYIEGYPGAAPIAITVPTSPGQELGPLVAGDLGAWSGMQSSSLADVNLYWFPGTKVIGAVNFGDAFFEGNDAHGTRSAASAAGNIHGSCAECLFVLVRNGQDGAGLRWAAAQPWIDVVTNSYGSSLLGNSIRDNIYFQGPVAETRAAAEAGQTILFSSGNGLLNAFDVPMFTYWSSEKGPDWTVTVGATTFIDHQTYLGAGKPVDISSVGTDYPSTGGTTAAGEGTHSGTSNATPVVAGAFAHTVQTARELLGDTTETHAGGVVASGTPIACGSANPGCPLGDGILTRSELRDTVFYNALPSAPSVVFDTAIPTTPLAYYYQGHGVIRGLSVPGAMAAERQRFAAALTGGVASYACPAGERNWFVVDSKCRQRLWGSWTGGYFYGQPLALNVLADPIATAFDTWCSLVPQDTLAGLRALPIPSGVSPAAGAGTLSQSVSKVVRNASSVVARIPAAPIR